MMLWEQVTGKAYGSDNTFTSMAILLWCIIEANNPGAISIEEFFSWMDDEPCEFDKLCKWLADEKQRQAMLADDEGEEPEGDKKKETRE